jgi:hypothetical protein
MTPKINDAPLRRLTVPDFSGGINYRDGISLIRDNQLADATNVWYKDGVLQTRPGFISKDAMLNEGSAKRLYAKKENFRVINGKTYFLVVFQYEDRLKFKYFSNEGQDPIDVAEIEEDNLPISVKGVDDFTCNVFQFGKDIYCFCSGFYEGNKNGGEDCPYFIYKIVENEKKALNFTVNYIRPNDAYIPTVSINGIPQNQTTSGDLLEGYNLLSPYAAYKFSSAETFDEQGQISKKMSIFYVPIKPVKGSTLELNYTALGKNTVSHKVTIGSDGEGTESVATKNGKFASEDELRLRVDGKKVWLEYMDSTKVEGATYEYKETKGYLANNVVITANVGLDKEKAEKVLNMTFSEWFGGGAEGIYGGIHLFMGGNKNKKEKALVCWSDFNRPLYFSENGFAYVGDKSQNVTAFGKQGENLVVFKERETYSTAYSSASSVIDADSVIGDAVVDVTAAEVTFPMQQVHGFIGCDCPNTVQLCRNRLVWAHSDGKVYTLVSPNGFNERAIFEVSAMVEKAFDRNKMKTALSADWDGHYILDIGDRFYLMDYNSYGFSHVSSYTKDEDSQVNIPWWIWKKPTFSICEKIGVGENYENIYQEYHEKRPDDLALISLGGKLNALCLYQLSWNVSTQGEAKVFGVLEIEGGSDVIPVFYVEGQNTIDSFWEKFYACQAHVQTKLFDFGGQTVRKTVPKTEFCLGGTSGRVTVTTITDKGSSEKEIQFIENGSNTRDPSFFTANVMRYPGGSIFRIGYALDFAGSVSVDSLTIYYKLLGGVR